MFNPANGHKKELKCFLLFSLSSRIPPSWRRCNATSHILDSPCNRPWLLRWRKTHSIYGMLYLRFLQLLIVIDRISDISMFTVPTKRSRFMLIVFFSCAPPSRVARAIQGSMVMNSSSLNTLMAVYAMQTTQIIEMTASSGKKVGVHFCIRRCLASSTALHLLVRTSVGWTPRREGTEADH